MNGWTPIWKTCGKTIVRKTVPQEFVFRFKTAQSADIRRFILFVFHTPPAPLVGFETEECMSILLESRVCLCRDPTCAGRWSAAVQRPAPSVFPAAESRESTAAVSPALDDLAQSMKSNAGALENRFRKAEDRITEKNNRFFSEKGLTYSYSNCYLESQRTANELGKP